MLSALLGRNENIPVLSAARKYVWIRALGMPAAAMIGSTQAACLGMQDTTSPLLTTLFAAVINLGSGLIFVRLRHPWAGGVAGAAWATILSQYVALGFYLYWLSGKRIPGETYWQRIVTQTQAQVSRFRTPNDACCDRLPPLVNTTVRGILGEDFRARDFFIRTTGQPSSTKDFMPYVIPVTTTQVGRCSVYAAMGIVVSGMDVGSMAANQIISSFFYALLPIADSLGQTAQALLPPIFSKDPTEENQRRLQRALRNFLIVSLWCGVWLASVIGLIPVLTKTMMTRDPAVQNLVNSVVPIFVIILLFQGLFYAAEGILLAQKDLSFVGRLYGVYFAIFPAIILQLQRLGTSLQLGHVWVTFAAYQLLRIIVWVFRVYFLYRRRADAIAFTSLEEACALHVHI
jgi:Na+-driven multidrug efflux pump